MKPILVPVDFSDATELLVEAVKKLAPALGARVILLHVLEYPIVPSPILPNEGMVTMPIDVEATVNHRAKWLDDLRERFVGSPFQVESEVNESGTPVSAILDVCDSWKADMIIMGSHGHGALYNLLVGSVTEGVLKSAKCPVLVVPCRSA